MPLFTKPQFNNVWASTGAKLTPDVAKISQGWVVEIPPHEFDNWMQNRQDALLAHLNQLGIPQWDSTVEYQAGKSYVQGTTTGVVYKALTTHSNVNPEIDIQNNWTVAFESSGTALLKANNLSDVPDKAQARINLGIATTEFYDGRYLLKSANFSDVPNKATARNNLGLGNSAILNVGNTASTVAAGDDSRIVNAVQTYRQVIAGDGLTGGGNLSTDRTISLGTPSAITRTSTNNVSTSSHSHSVDVDSLFPFIKNDNTSIAIGGLIVKIGITPIVEDGANTVVTFPTPFPNGCLNVQLTQTTGITSRAEAGHAQASDLSRESFRFSYNATVSVSARCFYLAIGW